MSEAMTDGHNWVTDTCDGCIDRQKEICRLREENGQMKEGLDAIIDAPPSDEITKLRKLAQAVEATTTGPPLYIFLKSVEVEQGMVVEALRELNEGDDE